MKGFLVLLLLLGTGSMIVHAGEEHTRVKHARQRAAENAVRTARNNASDAYFEGAMAGAYGPTSCARLQQRYSLDPDRAPAGAKVPSGSFTYVVEPHFWVGCQDGAEHGKAGDYVERASRIRAGEES